MSFDYPNGTMELEPNTEAWIDHFPESEEVGDTDPAQTGNYGGLVKRGVIDPPKVVRTALQDAAPLRDYLSPPRLWSLEAEAKNPADASWRWRDG